MILTIDQDPGRSGSRRFVLCFNVNKIKPKYGEDEEIICTKNIY